jgi:hypothetical protein
MMAYLEENPDSAADLRAELLTRVRSQLEAAPSNGVAAAAA